MQRILIIGSGGAGKSTLARQLGTALGLPAHHLDANFWLPNWVERDEDSFRARIAEIIAGEAWVLDGNYSRTLDMRLVRADTIIFLDFPRTLCTYRVIKRFWQNRGRTRADMGANCPEKLDLEFILWVWNYPKRSKLKVLESLAGLRPGQKLITLKSPGQVRSFLTTLKAKKN